MKKYCLILLISLSATVMVHAQQSTIFTSDIFNFWIAFDSVKSTDDSKKQLAYIQELYLDKATDGLKSFMIARTHTAKKHLQNILAYPKFWTSVRPSTLQIHEYGFKIDSLMTRFKNLYPNFKQPKVYFTIGILNSGGTTTKSDILIGAEIASATSQTEASELNQWLQNVFKFNSNIISLVAHEMGHTQQKNEGKNLLSYSIREGACDFIAEQLLLHPIESAYMNYGKQHETQIWESFSKEMFGQNTKNWLYNGSNAPKGQADLGYFIGYSICKSYYETASNKTLALKEIIELEYDDESVLAFLKKSKYNGGKN